MMAIAELARRRPAERTPPAPPGQFPVQLSEFIGDEVAAALTLTAQTAAAYLDVALDLATRLPETAKALRAGVMDYAKARLIAEATRILSDADARAVEARILPLAGRRNPGPVARRREPRRAGRRPRSRHPAPRRGPEGPPGAPLARGRWDRGPGRIRPAARRRAGSRPAHHHPRPRLARCRPARFPGRATRPRLPGRPPRPGLHSQPEPRSQPARRPRPRFRPRQCPVPARPPRPPTPP